jgi:hypothetical protein
MKKLFQIILIIFVVIVIAVPGYIFISMGGIKPFLNITKESVPGENEIVWGVNFSQSQVDYLKLNWQEAYLAMMDDLGAKNIKLHTNWNWVEGEKDNFHFDDIDWQINQAEQRNVKIIYVIGMKTGRWPECHVPGWVKNLSSEDQQGELINYITKTVQRYKDSKAIIYWQVENEPLFRFGECPSWYYKNDDLLKTEVNLVKALDPSRKIIISDSGERSNWFGAAKIGDIVGITMYRNAWTNVANVFGFSSYSFLEPLFYTKKSNVIKNSFDKDVICIELQAEPWASKPLMEAPIAEQLNSMNLDMFKENVQFAKLTGLKTFYFWGAEWWYWMKEKQGYPEIWNEARKLF